MAAARSSTAAARLKMRWIPRGGGRNLLVLGVPGYGSEEAGDELHALLAEVKPAAVLMESFAGECFPVPKSGAVIPYRETLAPAGLRRATDLVAHPDFRKGWTSEAVAVLTALGIGAEVRLCDRQHALSFERLLARRTLDQLRRDLIDAIEAVAVAVEQGPADGGGSGGQRRHLPQNAVCPSFPELWDERHLLMAFHSRSAADALSEPGDVVVVVGAEHVDPLAEHLSGEADAELEQDVIAMLLDAAPVQPEAVRVEEASGGLALLLEKRAAVSAFLVSTQSFPPEVVLPHADDIAEAYPDAPDQAKEIIGKKYPMYRNAFGGRLAEAQASRGQAPANWPVNDPSIVEAIQGMTGEGAVRAQGLAQLPALCDALAAQRRQG